MTPGADPTRPRSREAPEPIVLRPIGVVRSPFTQATGTPIQPAYADGAEGTVELLGRYTEGLADIDGFERLWLLCWLDRSAPYRLRVVPYRDTVQRGLFATRAPSRPNSIGLSVVRLLGRSDGVLRVADLDLLDGTPVLDIKPYIPATDAHPTSRAGWFEAAAQDRRQADDRFH